MSPSEELFQDEVVVETRLSGGLASRPEELKLDENDSKIEDPNAIRYLLNPFAVADCRALTAPVGHSFLDNGKLIKITEVINRTGLGYDDMNLPHPADRGRHSDGNYAKERRTPGAIADELLNLYAYVGTSEMTALRGIDDDDFIGQISTAILGAEVPHRVDIYYADYPVPILPEWVRTIELNAKTIIDAQKDAQVKNLVTKLINEIRSALRKGIESAQTITQRAITRSLDEKVYDKTFTPLDRRAFLALGQEIPDQLPTVTKTQNQTQQSSPVFVSDPAMSARLDAVEKHNRELAARDLKVGDPVKVEDGRYGEIEAKRFGKFTVIFEDESKDVFDYAQVERG